MKRRLTLAAIAVALGIVGWVSPGVYADGPVPVAFKKVPTVNAAPEARTANDDGEQSGVDAPEPLAVDDETAAADNSADSDAQGETTDAPVKSDSPVQINADGTEIEVIRERYPNRAIKIEREVTQDDDGNYVNHGSWKMFDVQGTLMVEGQYHFGERNGVWNRWYRTAEVELLKTAPYSAFKGPFISQATFDLGRLNGNWTIYDSNQHKISEWEFVDGERQGNFTWWFPTGQKMRECHYDGGELNGRLVEWGPTSRVITQETFEHGRRLGSRTEKHKAGGTKSEGLFLFAREVVQTPDDWWNAKPAVYAKQGKDERHGHWVAWYPNGQKQTEGDYDHDIQVGEFTWWYANGQRALKGEYSDGEQQGKWVWWHDNGQKSIQGDYRQGHPIGQWTWWAEDGKVARASELENGAGAVVQAPAQLPKTATPSAKSTATLPPAPRVGTMPAAPRSANRTTGTAGQLRPSTVR